MSELGAKCSDLTVKHHELSKTAVPYKHQADALVPMFKKWGFSEEHIVYLLREWRVQDESMLYYMGCSDGCDIAAAWCLVQAGRCLCGINRTGAIQFLQEAIRLIKKQNPVASRMMAREMGFDCEVPWLPREKQ